MMTFKEALRKNLLGMQKYAKNLLEPGMVCDILPVAGELVDRRKYKYYIVLDLNDSGDGRIKTIIILNYNKKTRKLKTYSVVWWPADDLKPLHPKRILTAQEIDEVLRGKVVDKLKGLMVPDKEGTLHTL
jgi:hypothetical protein